MYQTVAFLRQAGYFWFPILQLQVRSKESNRSQQFLDLLGPDRAFERRCNVLVLLSLLYPLITERYVRFPKNLQGKVLFLVKSSNFGAVLEVISRLLVRLAHIFQSHGRIL